MAERICSVDGCSRPHEARGYCGTHYHRWKVHGDPLESMPVNTNHAGTAYERVMARSVQLDTGCRVFTGAKNIGGYGVVGGDVPHQVLLAHRVVASHHLGPTPPDKPCVLHSCDNPPCVEITHLRYGTLQENAVDMVRRGRTRWDR